MLAKANRITSADDYRAVVRRGAKVAGAHTVSYLRSRESGTDARFGFIVSKKVGTAVRRNLSGLLPSSVNLYWNIEKK